MNLGYYFTFVIIILCVCVTMHCICCRSLYSAFGLARWLSGKESTCNAGDAGSIPGSGKTSGEGNGNPLQYSCLGNTMDEETGGQSMGVKRIGHDLATKQ